jgi:hypothetical protein
MTLKQQTMHIKKLCQEKGHCLVENEDGSLSCHFTEQTCLSNSKQRKNLNEEYFNKQRENVLAETNKPDGTPYTQEEIDEKLSVIEKSFNYGKHYWLPNVGCIDGSSSGIQSIENYCTNQHPCNMGRWRFDKNTFKCYITPSYCDAMKMDYENGMCVPRRPVLESIVGKFTNRGLPCPPYANVWGGGVRRDGGYTERVLTEQCYNHLTPE